MEIIKRDGRVVDFDINKIIKAIEKAFVEIDGYVDDTSKEICEKIAKDIESLNRDKFQVEDIQDMVEKQLMQSSRKDVAKAYIIYRNDRTRARQRKSRLQTEIGDKLFAKNVENQNANVDENSFGGRMGAALSVVMKNDALNYRMSRMARENHLNNRIYIHDLDHYSIGDHNCLSVPFDKLLANGFNTRQTDVRPAQSVGTAFQLVAVLFQLQSLQQFGGVSATHLDWTMVPYVRKSFTKHLGDGMLYIEKKSEYKIKRFHKWLKNDPKYPDGTIHFDDEEFKALHPEAWEYAMDMTEREVYQAVEGMYHNLKVFGRLNRNIKNQAA